MCRPKMQKEREVVYVHFLSCSSMASSWQSIRIPLCMPQKAPSLRRRFSVMTNSDSVTAFPDGFGLEVPQRAISCCVWSWELVSKFLIVMLDPRRRICSNFQTRENQSKLDPLPALCTLQKSRETGFDNVFTIPHQRDAWKYLSCNHTQDHL